MLEAPITSLPSHGPAIHPFLFYLQQFLVYRKWFCMSDLFYIYRMATSVTTETINGDHCELYSDPGKSPEPWKRSKEDATTVLS